MFFIPHVPVWWPDPHEKKNLTSAAIEALDEVGVLAQQPGCPHPAPPLLVLKAVVRRREKPGRFGLELLKQDRVDDLALEGHIDDELRRLGERTEAEGRFHAVHAVVLRAFAESSRLGHEWTGTEHLVLALFAADKASRELLGKHGVTAEAFEARLVANLTKPGTAT